MSIGFGFRGRISGLVFRFGFRGRVLRSVFIVGGSGFQVGFHGQVLWLD